MKLFNIVNGTDRPSESFREVGPWLVPNVTDHDVSMALKVIRSIKPTPRREAVEALRRIGKKSQWISEQQLAEVARFQRIPLFHLIATKQRIDSWLSSIDDYVEKVVERVQPADPSVRYCGGIPSTLVLAGNDFVTAPMMLVHALLAESPIVIKTSGVDPFTPYLFVKALIREGIKSPQLLHIESGTQNGPAYIGKLIQNTGQSMVFGEDATVDKVYDNLPAGHHNHKKIPFWTGRSGTIVLDDSDLPFAAQCVIESAIWNSGRSCVNTKKVFCSAQIASELEALIVAEADKLRRRPYDDYYCDIGPQRAEFKDHVLGHVPVTDLIYDRDLLIARCKERSSLLHEEYPYPVIALVSGPSDELVRMANASVRDTPSHLSMNMAVFTRDRERFDRCVDDLLAYKVTWNGTTNPFWVFDAHQGMFFFQEMMRVKAVSFGRPSLFERGAPLKRPWPW